MMANSPQHQKLKATAQVMANSPAQQRLNITAQTFANKPEPLQRMEDEEPLQAKFESEPTQLEAAAEAPRPNNTGLPDNLKSGIENLSGMSMDHVKVHYNSDKPAQLQAHAYAQGSDIHVAPGQEKHLPHEAWHVVQQAQGRVKPTVQLKDDVPVNDDEGLEAEADLMGVTAVLQGTGAGLGKRQDLTPNASLQLRSRGVSTTTTNSNDVVQCVTLVEVFSTVKDDLIFSDWIQARAGSKLEDWAYLLSRMSLDEVQKSLKFYAERTEGERERNSITIEDVIKSGGDLGELPDKQIDTLMLSSLHIGEIIAQKQSEGINVAGQVVALDDSAFAERHWEEFLFENRHLPLSPSEKATLKLREMARVDRVDGFQANSDGKIYMRPTKMGLRVGVHEGVHKYGGALFEALLGHVMNEGATDYIAMLVCAQVGAEIAPEYYPGEKKLLMDILRALKISDTQLFNAYFNNEVKSFVDALVDRIGAEHAVLFRKAKTVSEAVKSFNDGQQLVVNKK
ncbi:DUF4157 domain-containing protein [Cellvibrio sp.]|uniref:eCIS core domain-containing protein n=1 Tax=Cellvibrio sp. TaxID=1965322 RepID=UPI00374FBD1F